MPDKLILALLLLAAVGCGTIGGVFFAFSTFVIQALGCLPAAQGIAAMQSINRVVLNPLFLVPFIGTAVLGVILSILTLLHVAPLSALVGGLLYVLGTFVVTMTGNLPLNDRLDRLNPNDPTAEAVWREYLGRWTKLNHVRTAAALLGCALLIIAVKS